jgi:hypothetical protein
MKDSESFEFDFKSYPFTVPGYLTCKLPEFVKEELEKSIEKTLKNKEDQIDYRSKLAGNISQEFGLKITPKIKYLTETMSKEYFNVFGTKIKFYEEDLDFKLKSLWVNIQKKYEFNPVHFHSGVFSFVIWTKIPYELDDELEIFKNSNGSCASLFSFVFGDCYGTTHTQAIKVDKSLEWSMVFFPASLAHTVYPFFTSDDTRMSISGNVYYKRKKNKNVDET